MELLQLHEGFELGLQCSDGLSAWEVVQERHILQEMCAGIYNKVHPLVTSVLGGQRRWKEVTIS